MTPSNDNPPLIKVIGVGGGDPRSLEHRIARALNEAFQDQVGAPLRADRVLTALMRVAGQIIAQTPADRRARFLEHAEVCLRERSWPT